MQKLMTLVISILFSSLLWGETIYLDKSNNAPFSLDVLNSNAKETVIRFRLHNFEATPFNIDQRAVVGLSVMGATNTSLKGMPSLPRFSRDIVLPPNSNPTLKVTHFNSSKMALGTVAPSKGIIFRNQNPDQIPYEFSDYYAGKSSPANYPQNNVALGDTFSLRKTHGVSIEINPMTFNAVTGQTEIIKDLIFTVHHNINPEQIVLSAKSPGNHTFRKMYKEHFLNWEEINSGTTVIIPDSHVVGETGDLLIIAHDSFADELKGFVAWKEQMGFPTKVVKLSKVGRDYRAVKKYIQNEYNKNESLGFVILVGDAEFVPFHPGTSGNAKGNEADPMYGLVEGKDNYPDLIVARFSVKTKDELKNIVTRSIDYEKSPKKGDWQTAAVGIASDEGSPSDFERANLLKDELLSSSFTVVDDHYAPLASASAITDSINNGRSVINYIGHGSETAWVTGWYQNRDVLGLKNQGMLPMIISVACVNGHFNYRSGDSFAEAWMKAGTSSRPAGAIAIFASSTNQSWVPPTVGQLKIAKMIASGEMHTIGGLMMNGSVAVLEDGDSSAVQTFQTWHIFGDPTIRLQTSAPKKFELILPDAIDADTWIRNLELSEKDLYVSIKKEDTFVSSGISDDTGKVHFNNLDAALLSGQHTVTISGANFEPLTTKILFN